MQYREKEWVEGGKDDIVQKKAKELGISIEKLFRRAFADFPEPKDKAAAEAAYKKYCQPWHRTAIPVEVHIFCSGGISGCANPSCEERGSHRFVRQVREDKVFFCSAACMGVNLDALQSTPKAKRPKSNVLPEKDIRSRAKRSKPNGVAASARAFIASRQERGLQTIDTKEQAPAPLVVASQPGISVVSPENEESRTVDSLEETSPEGVPETPDQTERQEPVDTEVEATQVMTVAQMVEEEPVSLAQAPPKQEAVVVEEPQLYVVTPETAAMIRSLFEQSDVVAGLREKERLSNNEIADRLGLPHATRATLLYGLQRIIPEARAEIMENVERVYISESTILELSRAPDAAQWYLLRRVIDDKWGSVAIHKEVKKIRMGGLRAKYLVRPQVTSSSILKSATVTRADDALVPADEGAQQRAPVPTSMGPLAGEDPGLHDQALRASKELAQLKMAFWDRVAGIRRDADNLQRLAHSGDGQRTIAGFDPGELIRLHEALIEAASDVSAVSAMLGRS